MQTPKDIMLARRNERSARGRLDRLNARTPEQKQRLADQRIDLQYEIVKKEAEQQLAEAVMARSGGGERWWQFANALDPPAGDIGHLLWDEAKRSRSRVIDIDKIKSQFVSERYDGDDVDHVIQKFAMLGLVEINDASIKLRDR